MRWRKRHEVLGGTVRWGARILMVELFWAMIVVVGMSQNPAWWFCPHTPTHRLVSRPKMYNSTFEFEYERQIKKSDSNIKLMNETLGLDGWSEISMSLLVEWNIPTPISQGWKQNAFSQHFLQKALFLV